MKIISIIGPTALGKTKLALKLLDYFPVEFIICDSRKVYKYMDIGTAKPKIKKEFFHLIDILYPDEEYNAVQFSKDASCKIKEILKKGKIPVIVGGTVLYYKALFEGFFESPPVPKEIREKLYKEAQEKGNLFLYKKLKEIDPKTASKVHPNDIFRIVRALEVWYATGKTISFLRKNKKIKPEYEPIYICKIYTREQIFENIEKRTKKMLEEGLIEEVSNLLKMGYGLHNKSLNTIGYKETILYLQGRIKSKDNLLNLIIKNTKNFAKRQERFMKTLRHPINFLSEEEIFKFFENYVKNFIQT